jgi:hypothetical protein
VYFCLKPCFTTELVAVKIQLSKQKPLIVGSYYRPLNRTDNEYVNNSINELSELCTGSNNVTVWIGGDFNLNDISWPSGNIASSNHTNKLNRSFLDTFKDCLLEHSIFFCKSCLCLRMLELKVLVSIFMLTMSAFFHKCIVLLIGFCRVHTIL